MNTARWMQGIGEWARSGSGIVTLALLAMAGFLLVVEHYAHIYGLLPYIVMLLCPLLHLFMHGGHRTGGEHKGHSRSNDSGRSHQGHS